MNDNETPGQDPSPPPPPAPEAPAQAAAPDAAASNAAPADGQAGGPADGGRRKKRRRGRGRGGEGAPPHERSGGQGHAPHAGHAPHGGGQNREGPQGRSYVEDRLDKDAEQLARDARTVPFSRLRPLGILAQEVRRMVATGDPRDAREARRALVLLKSRVAYLAGRESGKERSALVKVREFVFRGVDHVTRNQDAPDPQQLRNFLDGIEALVGYHRFHADDRRRD
ncbi:MAG: type III-A CRISPR-associated protein Csm2 [Planctomycetes bacterium]|nr:type III-A CRISPR-associated protein Csm2 [Planctomycetota bacterium]